MNYFLVLNLIFKCFHTGKILSVRFLLTHPVHGDMGGHANPWFMRSEDHDGSWQKKCVCGIMCGFTKLVRKAEAVMHIVIL